MKFEGHLFMKQSKYYHFCMRFCIFCFSIEIFCCKNKCTVHISLRRYPSISPSKAGDKYSWSCMFVIFSTVSCSDVHGRLRFTAQKLKSLQLVFLLYNFQIHIRTGLQLFLVRKPKTENQIFWFRFFPHIRNSLNGLKFIDSCNEGMMLKQNTDAATKK